MTVFELVDAEVEMPTTWQQRTIDRRLSTARARALARSSRFLATALELVEESGRADFTIQTLIDRSNLSLRAFYQHFAGKEELLLALYENVTSQFTEGIRQEVAAADGPLEQLEAFCRGFLSRAESSQSDWRSGHDHLQPEPGDRASCGLREDLGAASEVADENSHRLLARGSGTQGPDARSIDHAVELDLDGAGTDRRVSSGRQGQQDVRGPVVGVVPAGCQPACGRKAQVKPRARSRHHHFAHGQEANGVDRDRAGR